VVQFGVLGPVQVRHDGRELPLGGPKQRALLAIFLLHANEVVSRDRLLDGLWGERPPPSAAHTLDDYVSRLRKALGADRIDRRPLGYLIRLKADELDLARFEGLLAEGREHLTRNHVDEAAATLRSALGLWRGAALADLLYEPFASVEAERLEEKRLSALEDRIEADLALDRGSEFVAELEGLVRQHPFRERLLGHLMLALYRCGRQAEALEVFRAARHRLADAGRPFPGEPLLSSEVLRSSHGDRVAVDDKLVASASEAWYAERIVTCFASFARARVRLTEAVDG
jgi:DNA-binding SARP family transcriptional activator